MFNINEEVKDYFSSLSEEKGRTVQRGIYKFKCMIGYTTLDDTNSFGNKRQRGLDDILADMRALPNVTIVTVIKGNIRLSAGKYIAGLSVKFIPTTSAGKVKSPESAKRSILQDIKRIPNLDRIFKVTHKLERIE